MKSSPQHPLSEIEPSTVMVISKNYDRFSPGKFIGYVVSYKEAGIIRRVSISKPEFKTLPEDWKTRILDACAESK